VTKPIILAVALLAGCTPGMHRAFQSTMVAVAIGADACSVLQTRAVLRAPGSVGRESNPLLGADPGDLRLGGAFAFNVGLVAGTASLRDSSDPATMDWAKDVLLATEAVLFAAMAYNDNTMTKDPHRCGVKP
jgi:hypothetical protein